MARAVSPWSRIAFRVNESAANTLTEAIFRTPVSATQRMGMQIRRTELDVPTADTPIVAPGIRNDHTLAVALSLRNGLTVFPGAQNPGVLHHYSRRVSTTSMAIIGVEAATVAIATEEGVPSIDWSSGEAAGGLIIATAQLSLYIVGGGNAGAKFAIAQVYYRLVELEMEELIAAVSLAETF